ncbi:MAG: sulfatase [Kiritimatiellaceae bacterium]|nr:sulfatase [Kiritimatiellaceae bacterium]
MTAKKTRPNILFALADDASHFSVYGHRFVKTPHFDRVAKEGVLLTGMFTTNPKSAPSRASMLTGMHTWQLKEACTHWCVFPGAEEFAVYPDLLEEAGYLVGFTGKGWGPGDWKRRGRPRNPAGTEYNERTLTPPEGSLIANCDYTANFQDFLDKRTDGQPFCFWYGGREPHRHYNPGEGMRHGKKMEEVDTVPPYWPDEDVVRKDMLDYAFETEWFDKHLGTMLKILEDRGELENTLVIVTSDNGCPFPRVKGQMYDDDFRMPFAAMWPGTIAAGRTVNDLASFIDLAPTFLELAGIAVPPKLPGKSLTDIFYSKADGTVTAERNRAYMGRERHDMGRENDVGYPVRCVRTSQYLYIRNFAPDRWPAGNPETGFTDYDSSPVKDCILEQHEHGKDFYYNPSFAKRPAEELYDIPNDPYCMKNLAADPAFAATKAELWNDLQAKLKETGDPRISGEGDIFETYEYTGGTTHSWKNYVNGTWKKQDY